MIRSGILLCAAALAVPGAAAAQTAFDMRPPAPVDDATPQIIGGQPASPADWPATFRFDTPDGMCTSTVIGPRVVLTAAHCVNPGATGTIRVGGQATNVTCDHHDQYAEDYRLDIALCLAAGNLGVGTFETLNRNGVTPTVNKNVILLGFGCRQPGGGGPSGVLYQGQSTVRKAALNDAYTETRGGAAVCFGDSGGGAYFRPAQNDTGPRRLFGVNSRGDILTRSLLTSVAHPAVWRFITDWTVSKGVQVCGINELPNCR